MELPRATAALGGLLLLLASVTPPSATAKSAQDAPDQAPSAPAAATLDHLAWMAGHWASRDEDSVLSEELWMPPAGGVMLGLHRDSLDDPPRAFFEYLRIEQRGDTLVYVAQPGGGEATEFALVEAGEQRVVFANPDHGFPNRLTYWLDGDGALHAEAAGEINGQPRELSWRWVKLQSEAE